MRESMFPNPGMACERQIELMRSLDGDPSVKAAEAAAWERASLTAVRQEVHRRNLDARRAERELAAAKANAAGVSSPDSVGGEATVADVSERPASSPATNPNASPNDVSSASKRARDPRLPSATSVGTAPGAREHSLSLGAPRTTTWPRFAAPRGAFINCATNAGAALAGVVCSASWRTRHTRWRAAVRRRGSSTRATTRASSRCSRCWARLAAAAARRVHGGGRDGRLGDARAVGRPHWSARLGMAREEGEDMVRVVFNGEVLPLEGARDRTRLAEGVYARSTPSGPWRTRGTRKIIAPRASRRRNCSRGGAMAFE